MKLVYIILAVLAFQVSTEATVWTTSFSGTMSANGSATYQLAFPAAGTATITCTTTSSTKPTIGGVLLCNGSTIGTRTPSTSGYTFQSQAITAGSTYSLYVYCVYGSGPYSIDVSLTYNANSAPTINSVTPSPSSVVYGNPVTVSADVSDPDGNLSYVSFTNNGVSVSDTATPYSHTYENMAVGTHIVTVLAVDSGSLSDDAQTSFSVTGRPITLRAVSGSSLCGLAPVGPTIEIVSGSLAAGDVLPIGLTTNPTISSLTAPGSYSISILGANSNYIITRVSGTWTVIARPDDYLDVDVDGVPDDLKAYLQAALGVTLGDQLIRDGDNDLYSGVVEAFGGSVQGTYSQAQNLNGSGAPGAALGSGLKIVMADGVCCSVNVATLTLAPVNL